MIPLLNNFLRVGVLAVSLVFVPHSRSAVLAFETINMLDLGLGNSSIPASGGLTADAFPYGNPSVLGGVPFILTDSNNQVWSAAMAAPLYSGPVVQTFPMAVNDIYGFYTLANLWWGIPGAYVTYTFDFDDASSYEVTLTNGVDLRDFNVYVGNPYAITINDTTTRNVYADPFTTYHLDRQWIDLEAAGHGGKNLVSFTITDNGGWGWGPDSGSRIFLAAATAQTGMGGEQGIPEPGTWIAAFLLGGIVLCVSWRRRQREVA